MEINVLIPAYSTLNISKDCKEKKSFEYMMGKLMDSLVNQVRESYFEIEVRNIVSSQDTEFYFGSVAHDKKAKEKIQVKLLSSINNPEITNETHIPASALSINGVFHCKIFIHKEDTPKVLSELLIDDIRRTFNE
jgi:hypothetical protein